MKTEADPEAGDCEVVDDEIVEEESKKESNIDKSIGTDKPKNILGLLSMCGDSKDKTKGIIGYLKQFITFIAGNSASLINLLIGLAVVGLERISALAIFQCPCYEKKDDGGWWYGMSYLIAPAIALLVIGYLMDPRTTRVLTGLSTRVEKAKNKAARGKTIISVIFGATIAPVVWVSIALLDGKYYACAMTSFPYLNACSEVYQGAGNFSYDFLRNQAKSQVIGWGVVAVSLLLAAMSFSCRKYTTDVSHWQKKYIDMTNEIEREEFEKTAKPIIEEDTKANLGKFLKKERSKLDWDDATKLYSVDSKNAETPRGYSSLQDWCETHCTQQQCCETSNGKPPPKKKCIRQGSAQEMKVMEDKV